MIEMRKTIYDLARQNPVFDFEQGVSADLNSICDICNKRNNESAGVKELVTGRSGK